jgi:hypothetical protein
LNGDTRVRTNQEQKITANRLQVNSVLQPTFSFMSVAQRVPYAAVFYWISEGCYQFRENLTVAAKSQVPPRGAAWRLFGETS